MPCSFPNLIGKDDIQQIDRKKITFLGAQYPQGLTPSEQRFLDGYRSTFDQLIPVPCGQCLRCRLARSREWGLRMEHESIMHSSNSFITLTIAPEYMDLVAPNGSLDRSVMVKFFKRLRKNTGAKFRYFYCGEYGEKNARPHYHACIFGYNFPDLQPYSLSKSGYRLYTSKIAERIWRFGFILIGEFSYESAVYIAKYVVPKVNGNTAEEHYNGVLPEFGQPSTVPAIGYPFLEKYWTDIYPHDSVVSLGGFEFKPPRAYDKWLEKKDPNIYLQVKEARVKNYLNYADDNTYDRLLVKEDCAAKAIKRSVRILHNQ